MLFKREEGFFVGAIMVNVVTTEFLIVAVYLGSLLIISSQHQLMITTLLVLGILFPIAFYHHSWSIWLGFDYLIESLPKHVQDNEAQTDGRAGVDGQRRGK